MSYSEYADQGQAQLMTFLKEKLAASQWKEADQLTKVLMIKTSSRKDGDYLYLDIDSFPDKEIKEIDRLWLDHSGSYCAVSRSARKNTTMLRIKKDIFIVRQKIYGRSIKSISDRKARQKPIKFENCADYHKKSKIEQK